MRLIFVFLTLLFCPLTSFAKAAQPLKIVSLKPNITDILLYLGLEKQIGGITSYCNKKAFQSAPPPVVADYQNAHLEKIIQTKPDLIIASQENSQAADIHTLKELGFRVLLLDFFSLDQLYQSTIIIGKELNKQNKASQLNRNLQNEIKNLKDSFGTKSYKTLMIVGLDPIIVAGPSSFLDEILNQILQTNAVSQGPRYPRFSFERILTTNPDIIFLLAMEGEQKSQAFFKKLKQYPQLKVIKNQNLFRLNPNFFRPSPNLIFGLKQIGQHLQTAHQHQK